MASAGLNTELRIVLIGKTGVGKSSLGNSLLQHRGHFHSELSGESVTKECSRGTRYLDDGSMLMIVDTPDLFHAAIPNETTITEIEKCVGLTSPGPHIFIFVLCVTRFTHEELAIIKYLKATFGDGVMNHVIVVFTGKDVLDGDDDPMTIQQYIANNPEFLQHFVNVECKGRYTVICNKPNNSGHGNDVQSIIDLIRRTVRDNGERYYTEKGFENAKSVIQEKRRQQKPELPEDVIRQLIRMEIQQHNQQSPSELRIVLVGKTGVGKSSLGNSLLGRRGFFPSKMGGESVTKECSRGARCLDDGSMLMVVDTPGLFDTAVPNEITKTEIVKCIGITSLGPHIFIVVLNVTRFTPEELNTIKFLKATFGDGVINHGIVVFTGKDALDDDNNGPITIQQYVAESPQELNNFITVECEGRYTAICTKPNNSGHENDVQSVIDLIRRTVRDNGNSYYTAKMLQNAESVIQEEIKKRRQQKPELTEDVIRELIRTEIQQHNQQSPPSGFWDALERSVKAGLQNLTAVVTLPVTLPLSAGKAAYDKLSK